MCTNFQFRRVHIVSNVFKQFDSAGALLHLVAVKEIRFLMSIVQLRDFNTHFSFNFKICISCKTIINTGII